MPAFKSECLLKFEKEFHKANSPDIITIDVLKECALSIVSNYEKFAVVNSLRTTEKGLIPLYACDSLLKSGRGKEYSILEKMLSDVFKTMYETGDDLLKMKLKRLHESWVSCVTVGLFKKINLLMARNDKVSSSETSGSEHSDDSKHCDRSDDEEDTDDVHVSRFLYYFHCPEQKIKFFKRSYIIYKD